MRNRFYLSALVAGGLWAGALSHGDPPPPQTPPGQPDNTPKNAKPGTGPATQPDNTPPGAKPGTGPATQPGNAAPPVTPPPRPPVVAPPTGTRGGTGVGGQSTTVSGSGTVSPGTAPVAIPPELTKLEAQAATEIPIPDVPAGRAPEAKRVAEAAVRVQRATWVVEKLLPAPPAEISRLDFGALKVGARGWVDMTGRVVGTSDGLTTIRADGGGGRGVVFGLAERAAGGVPLGGPAVPPPAAPGRPPVPADPGALAPPPAASAPRTIDLRGEYVVDRTVTVGDREVLVLKEVAAAKALDAATTKLINAARIRLEQAKAEYANAVAVLAKAKKKAVDAVMERATAKAAKEYPVPDNAAGEERIKAKAKQQELAMKLAKDELEKIAAAYGEVPGESRP